VNRLDENTGRLEYLITSRERRGRVEVLEIKLSLGQGVQLSRPETARNTLSQEPLEHFWVTYRRVTAQKMQSDF
jgi:hypothetical protein